jgi:large subunit ribosomal protein L23
MSYTKFSQKILLDIVKYPILSEKATSLIGQKQYSFAVDSKADKVIIKSAIEQLFNVKVISINTSLLTLKKRRLGKYIGQKTRYKRAIVKFAPGDSIDLFKEE